MKKLILVFAVIAIVASAYTQTDSSNKKMGVMEMNMNNNQNLRNNPIDKPHPDGVMMQNGKMMVVKNGQTTNLDHDMTMSNGTKIMSAGTYIKKGGKKMMLKEGQHIDMSGNMILINTNKDKHMDVVADSTKN